ncbi:MAG TPA: SMP-30/gluconolactonase/LRE family protein [Bryobacteraceae bacterium]|nr:SMP-30/gluconolactonase/LRE family protein [Bryobacteraceae bacterium]
MAVRHFLTRVSLAILCCTATWAQQYTITTIAGTGTSGFTGDGGAATSAQLASPDRVIVDSSGKIYIADGVNWRIRQISGGTINTIAGSGTEGYTGDGAAATKAELSDPTGIALDSSGNLYIADASNNVVRMVSTSGNITTFAGNHSAGFTGDGGVAVDAELSNPTAVAVDSFGNVFICDSGNNVIRKVSSANIFTVVGGAATQLQLNQPDGIAFDSKGAMYIADTGNRRIVKFVPGYISVIAGTGELGDSGDGGPAVKAALGDPMGLAVDAAGNLFIADTFNSKIRKVTPDGIISTVAGDGIQGYFGDKGLATKAGLYFPHDVTLDKSGNLYIADTGNNVVRMLTPQAPAIFANGVVNGARYKSPIAPGELASIFGTSFANENLGASFPLSTTLGGVSVTVNGKSAPILYVTPSQINFQVPWETTGSTASIVVTVDGRTSTAISVPVLAAAPGIFTSSSGQAAVQNADHSANSPSNPAKVGSTVTVYFTGTGPVSPTVADGVASPKGTPAQVTSSAAATIGSASATVTFAGLAPGFVGLGQLNVIVPSVSTGNYPLTISIDGENSNSATISVTQ